MTMAVLQGGFFETLGPVPLAVLVLLFLAFLFVFLRYGQRYWPGIVLGDLIARGDTVVVVEHDREIMLAADHVLDQGSAQLPVPDRAQPGR